MTTATGPCHATPEAHYEVEVIYEPERKAEFINVEAPRVCGALAAAKGKAGG